MNKVYLFLADGFETIEALAPVDIMRRANLDVVTVSVMGRETVVSAHGVKVVADILCDCVDFSDADALVFPGGSQGTENLLACEELYAVINKADNAGKLVAAICAAPMLLGTVGVLEGRKATCYPGCENGLAGAEYTAAFVERDKNIITACGPAASFEFAFAIIEKLCGIDTATVIREQMRFNSI